MTFDEWWGSRTFEGTKRTIAEEAWEAGREELLTRLEQAEPKEAPEQSECEHKFVYPDGTPFCKYCGVYTNAITPPKGE